MAETTAPTVATAFTGMRNLPASRQAGLIVALAAAVSVAMLVILWTQTASYSVLYSNISNEDASAVVDALTSANIPHKFQDASGAIMVPAGRVHEARIHLAGQGLPKGEEIGFEILQQDQGFGTSRFLENARFVRALEGELIRSVSALDGVKSARVHLAIPKQSVFIREKAQPTASVLVNLYGGRSLSRNQVEAVIHLVSASVPDMRPEGVKVVDQRGRLLSGRDDASGMELTSSQFEYSRRVEETYIKRIEDILTPVMGEGSVRAQVVADIDFTVTERTSETFNPDLPAIRSEQTVEDRTVGSAGDGAQGVPGALSNQPPGSGFAPAVAAGSGGDAGAGIPPQTSSRQETRNYELDKTISHTRLATGSLRRLSIAVVLNDRLSSAGDDTREPLSDEELSRFTKLIKESVGFDAQRGDSVSVINASFAEIETVEEVATPIWEQAWIWNLGKQLMAGLVVLLLFLLVFRPMMKSLAAVGAQVALPMPTAQPQLTPEQQAQMASESAAAQLAAPNQYENQLTMAREMVNQDPKRVAQVVKKWVSTDGQ